MAGGEGQSRAAHNMVARKHTGRKGPDITFKVMPPVTYFLQFGHLLNFSPLSKIVSPVGYQAFNT
jgi:hypothetical protein